MNRACAWIGAEIVIALSHSSAAVGIHDESVAGVALQVADTEPSSPSLAAYVLQIINVDEFFSDWIWLQRRRVGALSYPCIPE